MLYDNSGHCFASTLFVVIDPIVIAALEEQVMAEVHVLDGYYLAITLLITIAYQLFFFSIAFSLKFDKLTGICPCLSQRGIAKHALSRLCRRHQFCCSCYYHTRFLRPP